MVVGLVLYHGGSDGHIYTWDISTGELLWKHEVGQIAGSVSGPAVPQGGGWDSLCEHRRTTSCRQWQHRNESAAPNPRDLGEGPPGYSAPRPRSYSWAYVPRHTAPGHVLGIPSG